MSTTLIRLPNWIGDAVMAVPAIRLVIEREGQCAVWGPPQTAVLFERFPGVSHVFPVDEKKDPSLLDPIRQAGFGKVYLLTNSYSTARTAKDLGIPERIGYRRDWRGLLLTRRASCGPRVRTLHMVDYYLHLLPKDWRAGPVDRQPRLYLSEEEVASARARLPVRSSSSRSMSNQSGDVSNLIPPAPFSHKEKGEQVPSPRGRGDLGVRWTVGITPGAAFGSAKRWEPEWFREVARRLVDEGCFVVVLGAEQDHSQADFILAGLSPSQGVNLCGQTSLRELIAFLSLCTCLVTNDSGPMHLADAVGTPTVALFGSTDSSWTGPQSREHIILQADVPCSPCFLRECPLGRECMRSLTPDRVFQSAMSLISR